MDPVRDLPGRDLYPAAARTAGRPATAAAIRPAHPKPGRPRPARSRKSGTDWRTPEPSAALTDRTINARRATRTACGSGGGTTRRTWWPRWRALLEDRWQTRLREVTELSLAYHQAPDVIPDGQDAGEGGPEAQQLLDRTVAARRALAGTEEALSRLTAGTFGRCEQCGSALPPGLLAAVPEARYCPSCAAGPAAAINPRRARAPDGVSSPAQTAGHAVRRTRW